ncbi:hypothetical protein ACQJBY_014061 [Aegilops geniculata]
MALLLRRAAAAATRHGPPAAAARHGPASAALLLPAAPISRAVTRLPVFIRPAAAPFHSTTMGLLLRRAAAAARHRPAALLLPAAPISSSVTRLPVLIRPAPPAFRFSPRRRMCVLTESELNDLKSELIQLEADAVALYGSTSTSILKLEIEVDQLCKATADKAHLAARAVGDTSFLICGVVVSGAVFVGVLGLLAVYAIGAGAAKNAAGDYVDEKLTEVQMIVEKKVADQHQEDMNMLRHADMKLDSRAAAIKAKEEHLRARQAAITLKKTGATKHGEEGQVQGLFYSILKYVGLG